MGWHQVWPLPQPYASDRLLQRFQCFELCWQQLLLVLLLRVMLLVLLLLHVLCLLHWEARGLVCCSLLLTTVAGCGARGDSECRATVTAAVGLPLLLLLLLVLVLALLLLLLQLPPWSSLPLLLGC